MRTFSRHLALASLLVACGMTTAQEKLAYNRDIRPLLADACFKCHGRAASKGGVRLDTLDGATKKSRSGMTPIVPGKPEQSELVKRIFSASEDEVMPPPNAHRTLKPEEKERIKRWIAEGAEYQKHWSFEAPVKVALPKVKGATNPIDAFIAEHLQREKLKLSPEADRPTLIRRVAFALTGLPPTPAEVDAFLGDKSKDAYEKMVERFLASKHYGEEMARHWLDVARYADTHGLHLDNERQTWLYRDWVVKSFNDNQHFDQFTIEQLAGDLLPNPSREQLIATGFNRCNVTTSEGGSIDAEWVFRNAVDRTSTMMETWLALSGGCAVCHDHKFDPISAKEFYSLYAFFYSASGPALDGNKLLTEPIVKMSTSQQDKKLAELAQEITQVQKQLADMVKSLKYADPANAAAQGPEQAKLAGDPLRSFTTWQKQSGGKDAAKLPQDVKVLFKQAKTNPAAEKKLRDYYLENVCTETKPLFEPLTKQLADLSGKRDAIDKAIAGSFVFKDMPSPRESFVMMRGQYNKPGDKVEPNTPSVMPPLKKSASRGTRLDLAQWLVAPEHPLTARVAVNRFWQQIFGTGLVKSSSDFGTQGDLPTHPELLDYLAVRFRETNWDVKDLVRLMLHSATFRQSTRVTPELYKRDPDNRLLARGPRFRLDAEQIRDNALFVSGLINLEMGGRGVRPYQPPRIWEPVAFTGSNTMNYQQDKGAGLYRRSIYTFFKRTAPPPYLANFDAPNREQSCSRRERSNTPLQALQLMNDVQHFEAARKLAERILTEGGKSADERVDYVYRLVLARHAEPRERLLLGKTLEGYLARYEKDKDAAQLLLKVGESPANAALPPHELAAYTLLANLVLNLDETVMRN